MYKGIFYTHQVVVILFLLIYLIKTILLLSNKNEQLKKFSKMFKIPEMIVSVLFLATGVYMLMELPEVNMLMVIKLVAVFASIPIAVVAYKKSNKALAVLSLLLIIAAYGLAEMSKKKSATGNAEVNTAAGNDGKALFESNCTKCHGADGKAGLLGASDLTESSMTSEEIAGVIKNGKETMVAVPDITDEQAKAIAEYVATLKQ